jgi:poly-gamma-glutamate synthesis protein (capsule biosynthesis protein)
LLTHNGNRFAFLGCNYPGPASAQATANSPGAAACDYDFLTNQIQQLRSEGIIPIVTVQHAEYYHMLLSENQVREFVLLSDAGAVIVQGSQSHFAQPKAFSSQGFIDYGPGNLFFDQMDRPVKGTRNEFITRYTFYRGELLSIELTTWILEDYAQPREMTPDERTAFLKMVFDASEAAMEEYP